MLGARYDEVLGAARAGGEWAWGEIYRDLAGSVLGYLRGQGAVDPEDLTGEVFLQVVRDLHRFEGDEPGFRSWVFTIAHRRMLDARRAAGRRPVTTDDENVDRHPATHQDGHEDTVLEAMATDEIVAVLDALTPSHRDLLLLRIVGGLTIPECAELLGKRVGATKALQRRALSALRVALHDHAYP